MIHAVAVLGGGIAGAAAALRLAQGGLRPVWIAADRRDTFKPGEHLSAAAIPLLKTLGSDAMLRSEVHRHAHSTYSAWGSETLIQRNAISQIEGAPIVLDRGAFEDALSAQAIAAGAEKMERDVVDLRITDGHWRLDTGETCIEANFVFDATGRKAIVASKFSPRFQADKLSCQYAVFSSSDREEPRPVTLIEAEERGWWYMSVLADRRVVVNFYSDADLPGFDSTELDANARRTKVISAYLSDYGYGSSGHPTRITTNSSWIAPAIGAGWVAIGDASAAFDPLSSHGMTTALWSAIQAADAFVAQDRQKMQAYAENVASGVQDYLTARCHVYSCEKRWANSLFWARRHSNSAKGPEASA
ncbi:glycine oxidase maturase GoxB [Puniceibacterium sediminis]|uniref:Dehydrogenase (Flavoprotein) n=1 Tax=Puniceibacterium sediminis TaxID=1608407 RepID=A0A238WHY3_9RHOB|nr:glycine oxidase maturase GoxB [Puniceibacterium sediminis]SNR45943.1 Dehydrogenase (flavoprotein) [Puniceibacterium sediminis]